MSERRAWVTQSDLRMNAYYFAFEPTGVREIDEILSAVACAGKAYHHTESWNDSNDDREPTYAELIHEAAERAALLIARLRQNDRATQEIERIREAGGA